MNGVQVYWQTCNLTAGLHIQSFYSYRIGAELSSSGPNTLSLNTPAATSAYLNMEKSEAYRFPAHDDVVGIFFKQDTKEVHRERKKLWGGMFTPNGYVNTSSSVEAQLTDMFAAWRS